MTDYVAAQDRYDDRHRERVFVGVYSGDHACHLPFDVTAGSATRKHSGATVRCFAALAPSLYRASSPTITATGRQPLFRASPSLAGSIRLSRPGDVADPRTSQEQAEHPRVHQVYRTCDLRSLHWLMRIGGAVR